LEQRGGFTKRERLRFSAREGVGEMVPEKLLGLPKVKGVKRIDIHQGTEREIFFSRRVESWGA